MRNHSGFIIFALALAGLIPSQSSPSFAQGRIGNAAAISNQVEGINRNVTRTLAVGGDVFSNEQVRTGEQSTAQLVFLDNTNLNVGPKSTVTLDRFVYDPGRGAGSVVLRATRGLFRFVTGTQPPQDYKIVTPLATIGVRGTVFDLDVQPAKVIVILESGEVTVTPRAEALGVGMANSVIEPSRAMRPSALAPVSTNQMLPSGCSAIARGWLSAAGMGNSVTAPSSVMRATRQPAA